MNRRSKIIVSITGIAIVSLFLIALTYGYYVTKIKGNSNSKSITATTDNLELVYGDDDGSIIGDGEVITPNTTLDPKTFSVTNDGTGTVSYSVVLDNVSITNASTGEKTEFVSNDFVYTLTCTSGCNGVSDETTLPLYNNGILVSNSIDGGEKQTYSITITYKDTGVDQSADMGKSLSARINIVSFNLYESDKSSLAYNIVNNALNVSSENKENGYAEFRATPLTTPAVEISGKNESELTMTNDDYGTSYYYRGNVKNNYLTFNNMCWRVVRIEGDGAIKLVLEDQDEVCSKTMNGNWNVARVPYGYTLENGKYKINYLNYTGGMADNLKSFQAYKLANYTDKLKSGDWCYDDIAYKDRAGTTLISDTSSYYTNSTSFYYGTYTRMNNNKPSLKCSGTKLTKFILKNEAMYVGALTADEVVYAGGTRSSNTNYYLINDYQKNNSKYWWTISPRNFDGTSDNTFEVSPNGNLYEFSVYSDLFSVRPSIILKFGTKFGGGDGTKENPYVVE